MKSIINQSRSISSIQCLQYNAADKYSGSGSVHEYFLDQMCLYSAGDSFLKSPSLPKKSNGHPLSDIWPPKTLKNQHNGRILSAHFLKLNRDSYCRSLLATARYAPRWDAKNHRFISSPGLRLLSHSRNPHKPKVLCNLLLLCFSN